jgi:endonuclease/exonuclease/phosphatase family metal-dependent hydrolase
MDISVITFSTSACRSDYRARLDIMARELATLAPDIVLLQDVFATADGRYNTATTLARRLGMTVAFHPARFGIRHLDGRPIESHSGLAVLARARIRRSMRIELHSEGRDGERIGQLVEIVHGATTLLAVNVSDRSRARRSAIAAE